MIDEMDLVSGLKAAEPVRPHAFEEARAVLRMAMTIEEVETKTAPRGRAVGTRRGRASRRRPRRRCRGGGAGRHVDIGAQPHAAATGEPPATAAPAAANPILSQLAANGQRRPAAG